MKTSEDFKKLLHFLEDQNEKERKGYNQGVDVPLCFKLFEDPQKKDLMMDNVSIYSEECFPYLRDLSDFPLEDFIYNEITDIPKEELQPTLPEEYLGEDKEESAVDLDMEDPIDCCFPEDLSMKEEFMSEDDFEDDYEESEEYIEVESLIDKIRNYIRSNGNGHAFLLLNYNLYQYEGNIYIVDPGRCYDRGIDQYNLEFIKKVNNSLGL